MLTAGPEAPAMGAPMVSKKRRNKVSSSLFPLDLQNGPRYCRKFLKVTSSETSLVNIAPMLRTMFTALSALSGLGIIDELAILPLGLSPALLMESRSTNTVSGVSPQDPAL